MGAYRAWSTRSGQATDFHRPGIRPTRTRRNELPARRVPPGDPAPPQAALQVRHKYVPSPLKAASSTVLPRTLEENTMTQSTFPPPPGVQQPYGQQPYGQPGFGGPGAPYGRPGPGFGYQQ